MLLAAVSMKQAALREAAAAEEQQKIAEEALEHQAETEAKTRVEEGTAAELKSQVETVINKGEMIDVISCTRGQPVGVAPGCRGRHIVVSGRMCVLERGIQPAFSARAGQSGSHHRDHAGRSQRGVQQIGASTAWRLKEENRLSEGTALERDGEAWSLVERTWVTT